MASGGFDIAKELRIVLLGRTGEGKSSTGNSILGKRVFKVASQMLSVTSECQAQRAHVFGSDVLVVDTPGLFDTNRSNQEVLAEVSQCLVLTKPGPHVFLLVLATERMTVEIQKNVQLITDIFGKNALRHTIFLFTRRDDLEHSETTIFKYVSDLPKYVDRILQQCGNRYLAFNNHADKRENDKQVKNLLQMVKNMNGVNRNCHYQSSSELRRIKTELADPEKTIVRGLGHKLGTEMQDTFMRFRQMQLLEEHSQRDRIKEINRQRERERAQQIRLQQEKERFRQLEMERVRQRQEYQRQLEKIKEDRRREERQAQIARNLLSCPVCSVYQCPWVIERHRNNEIIGWNATA